MIFHLGFGGDLFLDPQAPRTQATSTKQLGSEGRKRSSARPVAAQPRNRIDDLQPSSYLSRAAPWNW